MMDGARCLQCGKFLKDAHPHTDAMMDAVVLVHGDCVTHGKDAVAMPGTAWSWDAWEWDWANEGWDADEQVLTFAHAGTVTAEAG